MIGGRLKAIVLVMDRRIAFIGLGLERDHAPGRSSLAPTYGLRSVAFAFERASCTVLAVRLPFVALLLPLATRMTAGLGAIAEIALPLAPVIHTLPLLRTVRVRSLPSLGLFWRPATTGTGLRVTRELLHLRHLRSESSFRFRSWCWRRWPGRTSCRRVDSHIRARRALFELAMAITEATRLTDVIAVVVVMGTSFQRVGTGIRLLSATVFTKFLRRRRWGTLALIRCSLVSVV